MNIVDIFVVGIFLFNGMSGLSKGFILSFFTLVGWILSYYIAKQFYPVFSQYILEHTDLFAKIQAYVQQRLPKPTGNTSTIESMGGFLNLIKIPESIKGEILNSGQFQGGTLGMEDMIVNQLSHLFINLLSMIVVFMAARLVISIGVQIINALAQLPILKQMNRGIGFVFGLFKGVLILYVVFALLTPVITMFPEGIVASKTTASLLGNYFYEHNIIMTYLGTLLG